MKQGVLRSSRYSPGNMDYESLEAVFVGRDDIMEDVLDRITTSISGPQKHYILLVGPRGSGKTHLLALAYHRLMALLDAGGTRNDVAIALLKEEEWGVASYLDLVVRILTALAENATELNAEIARIYGRFSKDAEEAEAFAVGLLRQHCEGKTLLLLCENLMDLFQGLGDEGQKRWRTAIQEDGNWTILATTPQLFAGVTLQNNPFYGFFTVRPLEKIDLDTGIDLLTKKAIHENKPDLADFLRSPLGRARARAVHHLAAGNHRAYVVMFDFLDKESLEDLIGPFMHMVDDLTPYYQDRMRQVPPAQRKIIEFLCLKGAPATVQAISTSCLMSPQTAAKQVGALAITGFVSRSRSGRNTFCELSEPLMRICIEVKDNKTQHVRLLVEFLRHWFTSRELAQRHAEYQRAVLPVVLDRLHVEEAVRCSRADQDEPLIDALHDEAKRCWDSGNYNGLATIQEGSHFRWLLTASVYARVAGDYGAAESYLDRVRELEPNNRELWVEHCRLCMARGATQGALEGAAGVEALPNSLLLGRLLAAQARAAREPLDVALETVGMDGESGYFKGDEQLYEEVLVEILSTSLRNFGPRHLQAGVGKLRSLLASEFPEGVLGRILTDLLIRNVQGFVGSLDEWEKALGALESSLVDLAECQIPLDMLRAAVAYTKTGDGRRLLTLPLERRQLLEEVLPTRSTGGKSVEGKADGDGVRHV